MKTIYFTSASLDEKAHDVILSIQPKLESLGWTTLNPSSDFVGSNWLDQQSEMLKNASVVIAFLTERRMNTIFEIGVAYGLGKKIILVADFPNIPSDLRMVQAIDARAGLSEITLEILRQISQLEMSGWNPKSELPQDLRSMLNLRINRPEAFELISSQAFEQAVYNEFANKGFSMELAETLRESGYDMRAKDFSHSTLIIEVKKLNPNSKISIAAIQKLLGVIHAYEANAGLLIFTSSLTNSAREFALRYTSKIILWSMEDLTRFANISLSPDIQSVIATGR